MSEAKPSQTLVLPALRADRAMRVLALNCGSLSLRWDLFDTERLDQRWSGRVDGLGQPRARHRARGPGLEHEAEVSAPDPRTAVDQVLDLLAQAPGPGRGLAGISAVGHRVLFGGDGQTSAEPVTPTLLASLAQAGLDPWRQAERVQALARCLERLPGISQVAVFDSAFFRTLPEEARAYALPRELEARHALRRQGFQGLSHKHAALRAAELLERPLQHLKLVSVHLGHGASACAIDHGRAVDTTMGATPLEGLPGGLRSGDVDPGLVLHLMKAEGLSPERMVTLLEREGGLRGLSGLSPELVAIEAAASAGEARAQQAIQVYCHRVRKAVGAMAAVLDGLDALVFTGGIGEGSSGVRARVCQSLGHLGLVLDEARNREGLPAGSDAARLAHPASRVAVLAVRSDEARMIARETLRALGREAANQELRAQHDQPVYIGVSAHHVHLCQAHVEALFGPGRQLTPKTPLRQPGQFAAEERVNLIGPRGRVDRVRVLGPTRPRTQVEISRTEEFELGIDAPIRDSGDLDGSPGLTLEGRAGTVVLQEGVICAHRHVHMSPQDAVAFGVRDKDVVQVEVQGERPLVFGDVLVRVKPDYLLEMHVDTDEANAAELSTGALGRLIGLQSRPA
ncbi:MAG TPA: acetate/propionate family kinase [Myxococcota bacterium]|nr:acetate/propionate family kinase [Myxococcota bacterium]